MISIRHIAEKVGVSRSAVSLALRNKPGVSTATRDKIIQTAEKLGYHPHPEMARMLSQIRKKEVQAYRSTLAWINLVSKKSNWLEYPYWTRVLKGTKEKAQKLGYQIELFWVVDEPDMSEQRLSNILKARGINGLLIGPTLNLSLRPDFDWNAFSVISIAHTTNKSQVPEVCSNHQQSITKALSILHQRHYKRVGLLLVENMQNLTNHLWESGLYLFQHMHPKSIRTFYKTIPENHFWGPRIKNWIQRNQLDVVVSPHIDLLEYLKLNHFKVPEQIGFICLDHEPDQHEIAGMDQHPQKIGEVSVQLLHGLIDSRTTTNESTPLTTLIEANWVEGPTIRSQ